MKKKLLMGLYVVFIYTIVIFSMVSCKSNEAEIHDESKPPQIESRLNNDTTEGFHMMTDEDINNLYIEGLTPKKWVIPIKPTYMIRVRKRNQ